MPNFNSKKTDAKPKQQDAKQQPAKNAQEARLYNPRFIAKPTPEQYQQIREWQDDLVAMEESDFCCKLM